MSSSCNCWSCVFGGDNSPPLCCACRAPALCSLPQLQQAARALQRLGLAASPAAVAVAERIALLQPILLGP